MEEPTDIKGWGLKESEAVCRMLLRQLTNKFKRGWKVRLYKMLRDDNPSILELWAQSQGLVFRARFLSQDDKNPDLYIRLDNGQAYFLHLKQRPDAPNLDKLRKLILLIYDSQFLVTVRRQRGAEEPPDEFAQAF